MQTQSSHQRNFGSPSVNRTAFSSDLINICQAELSTFATDNEGLRNAVIATTHGFAVADVCAKSGSGNKLASLCRNMHALTINAQKDIHAGLPDNLIIDSEQGRIIFVVLPKVKPELIFAANFDTDAPMGSTLYAAKLFAQQVASLIQDQK